MKLSIITINYDNKVGLEKTIESVANQDIVNNLEFEYIAVDGLSNDGSRELIKKSSIITKYKIEKDNGIADAFNKGISQSNGEYLYFLNSGDVFYDSESLQYILNSLDKNDIYIYKVAMVDEKGAILNIVGKSIGLSKQKYRNYLPHQGMLIKRGIFDKYGKYDIDYRLGMDYEWSTRLIKDSKKLSIEFIDKPISKMLNGGVSQTKFVGTFMAYHKARIKNKIMNVALSYMISFFFVVRRSVGLWFRKLVKSI